MSDSRLNSCRVRVGRESCYNVSAASNSISIILDVTVSTREHTVSLIGSLALLRTDCLCVMSIGIDVICALWLTLRIPNLILVWIKFPGPFEKWIVILVPVMYLLQVLFIMPCDLFQFRISFCQYESCRCESPCRNFTAFEQNTGDVGSNHTAGRDECPRF
jgi:hypothetical protein